MTTIIKREVIGQFQIQTFFEKEVKKKWKELSAKYSNDKGKILFAFFVILTDLSHKLRDDREVDPKNFSRIPLFLHILDEFLLNGWNIIEQVSDAKIQKYVDRVLLEFMQIGHIKARAIESKIFGEEKVILERGWKAYDIPLLSESAIENWLADFRLDDDWHQYYYSSSKKSEELKKEYYQKFQKEFKITPEQLLWVEVGLDKTARNQQEAGGNLPLPYTFEKLLPTVIRIMKKYGPVDEHAARLLLKNLIYSPGRTWTQSPFVGVVKRGDTKLRYIPILPSMFLHGSISVAWLDSFRKKRAGAKLQGMINNDWGLHFEEYVREILRKYHEDLKINQGRLRIKKRRFPEIAECSENRQPEIDVVAQSDSNVYLISCKAFDESLGNKLMFKFYLHDYASFRNAIEQDMKYAGEIERITRCIRNSQSFLVDRGFSGKNIYPLLVTSDVRPLSLESVRTRCAELNLVQSIPDVQIIQARNLKEIILD